MPSVQPSTSTAEASEVMSSTATTSASATQQPKASPADTAVADDLDDNPEEVKMYKDEGEGDDEIDVNGGTSSSSDATLSVRDNLRAAADDKLEEEKSGLVSDQVGRTLHLCVFLFQSGWLVTWRVSERERERAFSDFL